MLNIKTTLSKAIPLFHPRGDEILHHLPDVTLNPDEIKAILINEVCASSPIDDFYSKEASSAYLTSAKALFQEAGLIVKSAYELLDHGIYLTHALKAPKTETVLSAATLQSYIEIVEKEMSLFQNVQVIMLMGDVAIKTFNKIAKRNHLPRVIPAISTYKIRQQEFYYQQVRIFPSYIMTGKNILIEKSKFAMASEDIRKMLKIIQQP